MFQHLLCGALFGILLSGPLGSANELGLTVIAGGLEPHLNRKSLVVLWSQLFH
jgi:hypothetical protein